jgi:hypothetical protein
MACDWKPVVDDEKLLHSVTLTQGEADFRRSQVIGVLNDFDQSLERLDVEIRGSVLRVSHHLFENAGRAS